MKRGQVNETVKISERERERERDRGEKSVKQATISYKK